MVFTVHNLAFQGQFERRLMSRLGLPEIAFSNDGVEYYGDVGYLKSRACDWPIASPPISPTYAAEICSSEGGMGLDGLSRGRADRLTGILNGIDTGVWDPAQNDKPDRQALRRRNPGCPRRQQGPPSGPLRPRSDPDALLFGVVSRLSWQKGPRPPPRKPFRPFSPRARSWP